MQQMGEGGHRVETSPRNIVKRFGRSRTTRIWKPYQLGLTCTNLSESTTHQKSKKSRANKKKRTRKKNGKDYGKKEIKNKIKKINDIHLRRCRDVSVRGSTKKGLFRASVRNLYIF